MEPGNEIEFTGTGIACKWERRYFDICTVWSFLGKVSYLTAKRVSRKNMHKIYCLFYIKTTRKYLRLFQGYFAR
jgi:hypothetical protein